MAITQRGKRRLIALAVVMVVLGAGVAGLYVLQKARRAQAIEQAYVDGLAALEAEDYPTAVKLLARYANANTDDAEAWYAFARARLNVPERRSQHVGQAMVALDRVLEIDPGHVDASQDLLALYANTGTNERALELADQILQRDPENADAMRVRASSLARMEQPEAALEAARNRLAVDDRDWRTHLLALQLRSQLGESAETLLQEALELNKRYPDEPQFELIVAFAHQLSNDSDQTQAQLWLEQAAQRTPPDANFLVILVQFLDRAHLFGLAQQVLEREAKPDNEAGLFRESIRRAFEAGRSEQVLARLEAFERAQGELSVDDLALRALALFDLDQAKEARQIIDELRAYENEPLATAWSEVLEAIGSSGTDRDARIIQACQAALQTYPNNAFFHAFLGNAYARAGELDLALPAWEQAATRRTPWAMPRLRRAQTLLQLNRVEEAVVEAEAGYLRQPNHGGAAITLAVTRGAYLEERLRDNQLRSWQQQAEQLVSLVDQIQDAMPGEEQTLKLKVRLLAQLDRREEAADLIREILARDAETPLLDGTLLSLARTSARYELDMADAIYERLGSREEQTPQVVFNQAIRLAEADQRKQGLELLGALRGVPEDERPAWQLARAQYLTAIDDPSASAAWVELADAFSDNVRVQEQALQVEAVQADRAFVDRAIKRVRESLGDQGVTWRIARARWLLTGPDDERDPARAVTLLREAIEQSPDRVEPRLLLARAQQQLGLLPLAVREMNAAARLRPESSAIALQLAVLHQELRHFRSARDNLQQVVSSRSSTSSQLRSAAALLAQQGEDAQAMAVLERLNAAGQLTRPADQLLLAHLYRRNGQKAKVEAILPALLESPTPIMVMFAADYHAAQGQMEQAEQTLTRLSELELAPVERLLFEADFHASHHQYDRALTAYRAAVKAAPNDDETSHYKLIRFQIDTGDAQGALASAKQALAARPNDEALKQFVAHGNLVARFTEFEGLRPFVVALLGESEHRPVALRTLQLLEQTYQQGRPIMELARDLRTLADQHTTFAALQVIAARTHVQADRADDAVRLAQRAVETFPTAIEPARALAEALAAAERWQEARMAASEWRRRAGSRTLEPDLLIAEASLRTGRVNEALAAMKPYLEAARAQPDNHARVLLSQARSLLAARRADEAAALLSPTLADSSQWRQNWMSLAASHVTDRATAVAWMEQVAQQIPADAVDEKLALARSWWTLAERFEASDMRARAQEILRPLLERSDADASVWYFHGSLAAASGDTAAAERAYRRALDLDASLHVARNNLAMLLAQQPDTVSEALADAQQVVAAQPTMPTYLDTLAHVQTKAGRCDEAVKSMEQAIQLDPNNPTWHANLANVLEACGQTDQAAQVREQTNPLGQ